MSTATVLIVDSSVDSAARLAEAVQVQSGAVQLARSGDVALGILDTEDIALVIADASICARDGAPLLSEILRRSPRVPVVLTSEAGSVEQAVAAMKNGAADYLLKPFNETKLSEALGRHVRTHMESNTPVAADPKSIELFRIAGRVATCDATVMLNGESGCGKEVVARYIHMQSPRQDKPFVAINCAAIPENMLEAVLFGYEKGAFTGAASASPGKFEQAQGGTLLLDEISEMDLGLQAKLLRVIQEKEVERLGGRQVIPLDVRVLATTNRDLAEYVGRGQFREDLYYRLNVFPLTIRPLRERRGDIVALANRAIDRYAGPCRTRPVLGDDAVQKLLAHSWPGNVREIENVIQRSLILLQGETISADDLIFQLLEPTATPAVEENSDLQENLKHKERQVILEALRASNGNRTAVAETLGISPRTLRYKLARLRDAGIPVPAAGAV